jgi:hypothetical protein
LPYPFPMRSFLVVAFFAVVGCSKSAMQSGKGYDAQVSDSPTADVRPGDLPTLEDVSDGHLDDAMTPDAVPQDERRPDALLPDVALPDAALRDAAMPDAALRDRADIGCTTLPVAWLDEPSTIVCPPTSSPAQCSGDIDKGAVVARSFECVYAWGLVEFSCAMWPRLDDTQEFVVLEVDDCSYGMTIQRLEACADSIQIEYLQGGTCWSCDGKRSSLRVLFLPRDPRPVVAISQGTIFPPCLPPDLP